MKRQQLNINTSCVDIRQSRLKSRVVQANIRLTYDELAHLKKVSSGNVSGYLRRRLGLSRSNCQECGFPLPTYARSDSVFCSNKCKQRFWRKSTPAQNLCLNHTRQYHELYGCEKKAENNDTAVTGNQRSDLE